MGLVCMGQTRNAHKTLVTYLKQRGLSTYVWHRLKDRQHSNKS